MNKMQTMFFLLNSQPVFIFLFCWRYKIRVCLFKKRVLFEIITNQYFFKGIVSETSVLLLSLSRSNHFWQKELRFGYCDLQKQWQVFGTGLPGSNDHTLIHKQAKKFSGICTPKFSEYTTKMDFWFCYYVNTFLGYDYRNFWILSVISVKSSINRNAAYSRKLGREVTKGLWFFLKC